LAVVGVLLFFGAIAYYLITALLMPDVVQAPQQQSNIVIHDVKGQAVGGGHSSWQFAAASSEASTDGATITYHDASATYSLRHKAAYKLTAGKVILDSRTQNYTASSGVHVWSVGGGENQTFRTEQLIWNNSTQTLVCPSNVRLQYHGVGLVTKNMRVNLTTGNLKLGSSSADIGPNARPPDLR
jgi:hypothetical protein